MIFKHLLTLLRPYLGRFVLSLTGLLVSAVDMVIPIFVKLSIDAAVFASNPPSEAERIPVSDARHTILMVLIWTVAILIIKVGIFFISRYTIHVVGRRVTFDLRNMIYSKLMVLPDSFFGKMKTGEIMNRSSSDVMTIMRLISFGSVIMPNSMMRTIIAIWFMFTISWELTLSVIGFLPLVLIIENILGKKIHKYFLRVQHYFDGVSNRVQENLSGAKTIKAYAQENPESKRFEDLMEGYIETVKPINRIFAAWFPLLSIAIWVPIIGIIWYGGYLYMNGVISIGSLSAFYMYVIMLMWPMIGMGWIIDLYQRAKVSIGRIWEILRITPSITSPPNPYNPEEVRGEVEFASATLKYGNSSTVIDGLNLKIPNGQVLGIVGPVGAGKSSFTKLMLRTWDVSKGSVKIDGVDVRDWDLNKLRSSIGYVPQDSFLFSSNIYENISFIKPDASKDKIIETAKKVQLHKEIEGFDNGYDTVVGERGVTLSGGQRQRVAIARAILADPPIMIFDDPLSAVDTSTESAIIDAVRPALKDRTAIIIAHRVSIMTLCDRIVVLKDGKIAEDGSHEELLELGGYYAELVEKQKLQTEIEKRSKGKNNNA